MRLYIRDRKIFNYFGGDKLKKILIFCLLSLLLLTGCSKETKTTLCKGSINNRDIEISIIGTDKIQKITQKNTTNTLNMNEDDIKKWVKILKDNYNEFEGIDYSSKIEKNELIETITIDTSKAKPEAYEVLGLEIDSQKTKKVVLNFSSTVKKLEKSGFKCVDK